MKFVHFLASVTQDVGFECQKKAVSLLLWIVGVVMVPSTFSNCWDLSREVILKGWPSCKLFHICKYIVSLYKERMLMASLSLSLLPSKLRGGERVSRQPPCVRTMHASSRDVLCYGLEETLCVMNALWMQRVIAHHAPWQRVRNMCVTNAACHRASRTVAASEM